MFGEIFQNRPAVRKDVAGVVYQDGNDSWEFAQREVFAPPRPGTVAVGFKLFHFHARGPGPEGRIWPEIARRPEIAILRLGRRNAFAGHVSETRARLTDLWHPRPGDDRYDRPVDLMIDVEAARRYVLNVRTYQAQGAALAKGHPGMAFDYEDLQADARAVLVRVLDCLGGTTDGLALPAFQPGSASRARTVIRNLAAVEAMLAELDETWMLEPFR